MQRFIYLLCFAVALVGYSMEEEKLEQSNLETSPPDGTIPVVLDYTELIYDYNVPEKDKQLFEFEDETWKLLYIADWW